MDLILSRDNILLAYRNIKANGGSYTAGTDNRNISDIGCLPPETVAEKVRFIVTGSQHGYRPKPVRRKDIPKPNGKTRPLGIPCIWDRLVQQCIKQVMEPIRMPDGTTLIPDKGTPQGGIISPLLANIVLNELDKWVESQWQNHPLVKEYGYERKIRNSITFDRSKAFLKMRKTGQCGIHG